ncbi:hypothetical protein ACGFOU_09035 [Streptomyces sp. NPDC048595]|uniref:5-methylcytosine restriction system specificity protein McrC n=1 Tax=Streptomyces sp. NPDC048595 TaxID=3365576 RepID=UPI00371DF646
MKPDFVLYGPQDAPLAVADAKYKAEKRGGYPDADLYQMLAYCTALGLPEGHLIYAKGNVPHASHRVRHAGTSSISTRWTSTSSRQGSCQISRPWRSR